MVEYLLNGKVLVHSVIPQDFYKQQKIFIVGPPRSGTTMLNSMLAGEHFLPECTFVSNLFRQFDEIHRYGDKERLQFYIYSFPNLIEIFKKPINDMLYTALLVSGQDKLDRVVYKDPALTRFIIYFDHFFGNHHKTIFCMRDPRDTIASMLTVLRKNNHDTDTQALFTEAINNIFPYYQVVYDIDHKVYDLNYDRILIIKYENVVNYDRHAINSLERFVGFSSINFGSNSFVKDKLDVNSPFYSSDYGEPVTTNNVGKYKTILTTEQISEVERIFGYYFESYDYR
jgi:hypothetical protein